MKIMHFVSRASLALVVAVAGLSAYGKTMSPAEALHAAFGSAPSALRAPAKNLVLSHTCSYDGIPAIYLFEDGNGIYLISADDVAKPLLGYAERASYDPVNLPPALLWYIENQSKAIASLSAAKPAPGIVVFSPDRLSGKAPVLRTPLEDRLVIEPLLSTKWNQDSPYNDQCPLLDGQRAVTGCVATATAQVMKYHQWPPQGIGSLSYDYTYNGSQYTESATFEGTVYDWASMLDSYANGAGTEQQRSAVALLMHQVGMACQMNYSPTGSGAFDFYAAMGLLDYFDYDNALTYEKRDWYTQNDWNGMVYDELMAGRPVVYGGFDSSGSGHEFVCDGYYGQDLFHINWGWGGTADGYFLLPMLNPNEQGIGGGSGISGFSEGQSILKGMQKNLSSAPVARMAFFDQLTTDKTSYSRNSDDISFDNAIYSFTPVTASFSVGLKFINEDDTSSVLEIGYIDNLESGYGFLLSLPASYFPVGDYTVMPVCKFVSETEWQEIKHDAEYELPRFVVTEDNVLVNPKEDEVTITCTNFTLAADDENDGQHLYPGHSYNMSWDVTASGVIENVPLYCCIFNSDYQIVALSNMIEETFSEGNLSKNITWSMTIPSGADAGSYYISILKYSDNTFYILPDVFGVTVEEGISYTRTARLQDIRDSKGENVEMVSPGSTYSLTWLLDYNGYSAKNLYCFFLDEGGNIQSYGEMADAVQGPFSDLQYTFTVTVPEDYSSSTGYFCIAELTTSWEVWDESVNEVDVVKSNPDILFCIDEICDEEGSPMEDNLWWMGHTYSVNWHTINDGEGTFSVVMRLENLETGWTRDVNETFEKVTGENYYGVAKFTVDSSVVPGTYRLALYDSADKMISLNYYDITIDRKTGIVTLEETPNEEYYTLNGLKVTNRALPGLKISTSGRKTLKVK